MSKTSTNTAQSHGLSLAVAIILPKKDSFYNKQVSNLYGIPEGSHIDMMGKYFGCFAVFNQRLDAAYSSSSAFSLAFYIPRLNSP